MAEVTLKHLAKQIAQLQAMQTVADWVPEDEAAKHFGMSASTLAKHRQNYDHKDGWKYIGGAKEVSKDSKTVRRHIIWSKRYILDHIFTNVA